MNLGRALRVFRAAEARASRSTTRTSTTATRISIPHSARRRKSLPPCAPARRSPSNDEPDRGAVETGQEQLRAAPRVCLGRQRRRPNERFAAATAWPTSATSETSRTTCCSTRRCISSPRSTRQRMSPSQPIFTDNAGPFGGVAGVTQDDPARQPAARRPEHQDGVRPHLRPVVPEGTPRRGHRLGRIQRSTGRKLYDLADVNKRGAPLVYEGIGGPTDAAPIRSTRRSTRAATADSRSITASPSRLDTRQLGDTGLAMTSKYTLSNAKDNLSGTFSDADNNGYFQTRVPRTRSIRCSTTDTPDSTSGTASPPAPSGACRSAATDTWARRMAGERAVHRTQRLSVLGVRLHQRVRLLHARARSSADIDRNVASGSGDRQPERVRPARLRSRFRTRSAATCIRRQGNSDFGPYPDTHDRTDAFRGPGAWNVDLVFGKRFRFGNKAALIRIEVYNVFNHPNMYVAPKPPTLSSFTRHHRASRTTNRRMQLGFKFEF